MAKNKNFSMSINGKKLTFYRADIEINDECRQIYSGDGYNHPRIRLISHENIDGYQPLYIYLDFQRHLLGDNGGVQIPALGWTDTKRRWSISYGGKIEVEKSAVKLENPSQKQPLSDLFKQKLAEKIEKTIDEFNLRHVERDCELKRVVLALEKMGIALFKFYVLPHGDNKNGIPLSELEYSELQGNARFLQEKRDRERELQETSEG